MLLLLDFGLVAISTAAVAVVPDLVTASKVVAVVLVLVTASTVVYVVLVLVTASIVVDIRSWSCY